MLTKREDPPPYGHPDPFSAGANLAKVRESRPLRLYPREKHMTGVYFFASLSCSFTFSSISA